MSCVHSVWLRSRLARAHALRKSEPLSSCQLITSPAVAQPEVVARDGNQPAGAGERERCHPVGVIGEGRADGGGGREVPELDRSVELAGDDEALVDVEGQRLEMEEFPR